MTTPSVRNLDRHALAAAYDAQRARVIDAYQRHGHSARHRVELHRLTQRADDLHAAERAAGVPIGSTRERAA